MCGDGNGIFVVTRSLWTQSRRGSMNGSAPANFEVPHGCRCGKAGREVLALLYLNSFDDKSGGRRAWKGFPWSVMDQLHEKGYIFDPATRNKSVWLSEKGARLSEELCEKLFAVK